MTTTKRVWFDDLMCCGEPFAIGSTVTWLLYTPDERDREFYAAVLGEDEGRRITDVEERHDFGGSVDAPPLERVSGVVRSIEAVAWAALPPPVPLDARGVSPPRLGRRRITAGGDA